MPQVPAVASLSQEEISAQLGALRGKASELKLRISDLAQRQVGLTDASRRRTGFQDRPAFDKQIADVQHELAAAQIQLETTNEQIQELQTQRDMSRAFSLGAPPAIAMTAPPPESFPRPNDIMAILGGGAVLMFPLVLVLARRLWVRGVPRPTMDLENSPRLQRIEQAIESIAVEVERIGEAQRFTTKLFAERQPDAAARLAALPRREPGTITPH
jgi:hypothetical protein